MRSLFVMIFLLITACNPLVPEGLEFNAVVSPKPGFFEITSSTFNHQELTLTWIASKGAESYAINYRRQGSPSYSTVEAASPHTLAGLLPGESYELFVTATNVNGVAQSSVLTLTLSNLPTPIAHAVTPTGLLKNKPSFVNLSYTVSNGGLATSCTVSSLTNLSLTTPCDCLAGVCSVGVTPTLTGSASFSYTVVANGYSSNIATATALVDGLELDSSALKFANSGFGGNCKEYVESNLYDAEGSGLYWIDPDGAGAGAAFKAYCEMSHDGGGWTLITNRKGNSAAIEDCGVDLGSFLQNTCGTAQAPPFGISYNIGSSSVRSSVLSTGEWLFLQQDSFGAIDSDDAFIIHSSTDIFPVISNVLVRQPVAKVCDYNNDNCDSTDVLFYYVADGWFSSSQCNGFFENSAGYKGMYGYCHDGITNEKSNKLFGTRDAYDETRLWNYGGLPGQAFQETIYVR